MANSTILHEQQEAVLTAQSNLRNPPEWAILERQEEEEIKRNQQLRQAKLTDNSQNRTMTPETTETRTATNYG